MDNLITVIVPAYNIAHYLPKTLDSILAQTYKNLEIIVVNDGSKDTTAEVIDSYAARDPRIKAVHKENGGVTSARLKGLSVATGQYVGFVDGDDYVDPWMYQRLMDNMTAHDAEISHCGYRMVFPGGKVDYYFNTGKIILQKNGQGCSDLLEGSFVEPALGNKLYRRELFDGLESWLDPTIRNNEDLLMNFYLFRQANVSVFEDTCFYHYLLRRGSATTSRVNENMLKDPLRVRHLLYEETKDRPEWNRIAEYRLMYQLVRSATLELGDQKEMIGPFRKEARKELRQRLRKTLKGKACSRKLKVMVLWTAIWPWSYYAVHRLYARVTGVDKKYTVE